MYYLDQALTLFDAKGEQIEVAQVLADIGLNYYSQNHFQRAMDVYLRSMKILESENQTVDVIDLRNRMSMILRGGDFAFENSSGLFENSF
ncbi:MAG: hypothetical protein RIF46_13350 [Cyclobacteriaceae bacterium]